MSEHPHIKAVIFDWGGVCCSEGEPFASVALQAALGGMHPNDIAKEVMDIYLDYYRGAYTPEAFWRAVLTQFGLEEGGLLTPTQLTQAYLDSYTVWDDVLDTARALKKQYAVGLLSDLTEVMRDHIIEQHNIKEVFDVPMFSCDPGVHRMKQDGPEIFRMALAKLGAHPQETLFIDNSASKIAVAKEAGLRTMHFLNRDQFHTDIAPYL